MKHPNSSETGSPPRPRRHQSPAWIGIARAFDGDDDGRLMQLQAHEFPAAMRVLFDWSRDAYRRAEAVVGVATVLGDVAAAERVPDPRCLRAFYAYAAACYRRERPSSAQGVLPLDGRPDDVRMVEEWQAWLGWLFRRMVEQPAIVRDVLVAQVHATARVGREAGTRVMREVSARMEGSG